MHNQQTLLETTLAPPWPLPASAQFEQLATENANNYLAQQLNETYTAIEPRFTEQKAVWTFFVQWIVPDLQRPVIAGRVQVDVYTGEVIPLTPDELWQIRERAALLAERQRGRQLAFGADGFILPYQARIKANVYASDQIAFFAHAVGRPAFCAGPPPVWRVAIGLQLPKQTTIIDLGSVDVNALTGEVLPLRDIEIQTKQSLAHHAALSASSSPKPRK